MLFTWRPKRTAGSYSDFCLLSKSIENAYELLSLAVIFWKKVIHTFEFIIGKNMRHIAKIIGDRPNASKLRMFSSVGCAVRTVKILTGWNFGAHGAPYYDTYFP